MLHFFRKYQKYFFLFITAIIVVTFLFFGSYQAMAPTMRSEGEEKSHTAQMIDFLNTEQWMVSRKLFGTNFLNDGVISKEFLETGIADLLVSPGAFVDKLEKERGYVPYRHPNLSSLSAETVWSMFAPELPLKLKALQAGKGEFQERKELFLAQKNFPPTFLSQFIRYQEQSNPRELLDPRLAREDFSLFGYQTFTDWFGEAFVESIASQIIKIAQIARKLNYSISKEEALAELVARSQEVYEAIKGKIELPVTNGYDLFQLYMRHNGLKEENVLKIWEEIALFKRLMHAVGAAALVDPLALTQFYAHAHENATIELYQMSPEFRFSSVDDLKEFEVYITAVGQYFSPGEIPIEYAPLPVIELKAPELVGKRYHLLVASLSKKDLQSKVSVKKTLEWECESSNWNTLKKQFPELAQKKGTPFDILESLDPKGRRAIDTYTRNQIIEAHPEWIDEALYAAKLEKKELFLTPGIKKPFEGLSDLTALAHALESCDELMSFTQDGTHYYRFLVEKRGEHKEIIGFKEAKKEGILAELAKKINVEAQVTALKESSPQSDQEYFYAYRFASFILQHGTQLPLGNLAKQFVIEKREKTITCSEPSFINLNEVLELEKGTLSNVKIDRTQGAYLYRFLERKIDSTLPLEKIKQYQELLSKEARCRYFEQLLKIEC